MCRRACAARAWRRSSPGCIRISTRSRATIRRCRPACSAREFQQSAGVSRRARGDEPAPGSGAHAAAAAGRAGLSQLANRQVVAGQLSPRRLHARHDRRASATATRGSTSAARRCSRSTISSPQSRAAEQAVLRLVRADDAARSAHAAGAAAGQIPGRWPPRRTSPTIGRWSSGSTKRWANCSTISTSRSWPTTRSSFTWPTTAGFRTSTAALRPQVQAIALRRRPAHADHGPLAGHVAAAEVARPGDVDRPRADAAGGARRRTADAAMQGINLLDDAAARSDAQGDLRRMLHAQRRRSRPIRPPICAGAG